MNSWFLFILLLVTIVISTIAYQRSVFQTATTYQLTLDNISNLTGDFLYNKNKTVYTNIFLDPGYYRITFTIEFYQIGDAEPNNGEQLNFNLYTIDNAPPFYNTVQFNYNTGVQYIYNGDNRFTVSGHIYVPLRDSLKVYYGLFFINDGIEYTFNLPNGIMVESLLGEKHNYLNFFGESQHHKYFQQQNEKKPIDQSRLDVLKEFKKKMVISK